MPSLTRRKGVEAAERPHESRAREEAADGREGDAAELLVQAPAE